MCDPCRGVAFAREISRFGQHFIRKCYALPNVPNANSHVSMVIRKIGQFHNFFEQDDRDSGCGILIVQFQYIQGDALSIVRQM